MVTSFAVEALDWLRDDPGTTLLQDIVTLLSQTAPNVVEIDPGLGDLKQYELRVNQLWLLSMILSLSAVIFGTLCLQWLSAFRHADDKYKAGPDTLALRQVRFEGIWAWGVPHIPALLIDCPSCPRFLHRRTPILLMECQQACRPSSCYSWWNINICCGLDNVVASDAVCGMLYEAVFRQNHLSVSIQEPVDLVHPPWLHFNCHYVQLCVYFNTVKFP